MKPATAQTGVVGRDYAHGWSVWHNVTATTWAAGPSLTRGPGYRLSGLTGPHPAGRRSYRDSWEKTTPVAVKIKLKRMGKIHAPYYRVVVADARAKRDGRAIEEIGKYHPKLEPSLIDIDSERAQYWLSVGAQPTDPVRNLLKITGDWQRFHGEDGTEGTLKTASPTPDKKEAFAAALKETYGESEGAATTPKGRRRPETKAAKPEARPATAAKAARAAPGAEDDAAAKPETGKAASAEAASAEAASAEARADAARPAEDKAPAADQAAEDGNAATSAASTHAAEVDGDATAGAAAAADEVGSGA